MATNVPRGKIFDGPTSRSVRYTFIDIQTKFGDFITKCTIVSIFCYAALLWERHSFCGLDLRERSDWNTTIPDTRHSHSLIMGTAITSRKTGVPPTLRSTPLLLRMILTISKVTKQSRLVSYSSVHVSLFGVQLLMTTKLT